MTHDDDDKTRPATKLGGTDGWVESPGETKVDDRPQSWPDFGDDPDQVPARADQAAAAGAATRESDAEDGKALAVLSHLSILFGIPVFLVPMLQRDNAFALHHAKSAAVIFIAFVLALSLSMVTCGLAMPLALLVYVPALVGIVNASRGEEAGPWAFGGFGEQIFDSIAVEE